jgi:hypothetical protein
VEERLLRDENEELSKINGSTAIFVNEGNIYFKLFLGGVVAVGA